LGTDVTPSLSRKDLSDPTASRGVVGFEELILGAYAPLLIAAMVSVSLACFSSAMDASER
jgi:hypothetical protein